MPATPVPPSIAAAQLERARIIWRLALLSPVAYFLLAILLQSYKVIPASRQIDLEDFIRATTARWFTAGLLAGLIVIAGISFGRSRRLSEPMAWWRRYLWNVAGCDTLACAGLIYWLVTH